MGRVVEARQQVQQRRLARAGRAADGDDLSRLDVEARAAQHLLARQVRGADVLVAHVERPGGERPRRRRLRERGDPLEPGEAAAGGGDRALAEVDDPAERLERPCELEEEGVEEHELADRERAVDHLAPAHVQDGRDRERRQEDQARQELRLDERLLAATCPAARLRAR